MERRIPVEPTSSATEANVCSRGWLRIVAATAARPGIPFRCPSKARSFDPGTPLFRPLAIDGISVTVRIDGARKRR